MNGTKQEIKDVRWLLNGIEREIKDIGWLDYQGFMVKKSKNLKEDFLENLVGNVFKLDGDNELFVHGTNRAHLLQIAYQNGDLLHSKINVSYRHDLEMACIASKTGLTLSN